MRSSARSRAAGPFRPAQPARDEVRTVVTIRLNQDGSLASEPEITSQPRRTICERRAGKRRAGGPAVRAVPSCRRRSTQATMAGTRSRLTFTRPHCSEATGREGHRHAGHAQLDQVRAFSPSLAIAGRRPGDAARPSRWSRSTSPAATSSRCRSPFRISSAGGPDAQLGVDIAGVIAADLKRSGLFQPLDPATVHRAADRTRRRRRASATGACSTRRRWSSAGWSRQPDGRLRAEFRLWDVFAGQQMAGQQFFTSAGQLAARRPHHRRRDLRAADRREGLFRHPHRLRRRERAEGQAASSASRSWTRTAPTSAT